MPGEDDRTRSFRGSKSRNKVSVGTCGRIIIGEKEEKKKKEKKRKKKEKKKKKEIKKLTSRLRISGNRVN